MDIMSAPVLKQQDAINTFASYEILSSLPGGVLIINVKGQVEYFNNYASEVFGPIQVQEYWDEILSRNILGTVEQGYYISLKNGRQIILKTQSLPNHNGQIILVLDETSHKLSNEQVLKMEKLATLGKISASLAHQLKTPLSTAFVYLSNLKIKKINEAELKIFYEKMKKQLMEIKNQIDHVLLVCRGGENIVEKVNLEDEIRNMISNYKDLFPGFTITLNIKDKIGSVLANKQSINGAITNIIENAIQATVDSKQKVEINVLKNKDKAIIEVVDYGIGISKENLKKVCTAFFTTKNNGTGLGLAIAKNVIESHQGTLNIISKSNEFTKITIQLPLYEESCV